MGMREMVAHKIEVCFKCGREIPIGELYWRTGKNKDRKIRSHGKVVTVIKKSRGLGIRSFCLGCINSIYVDGD
jgi:hypothetical protein